MGQKIDGTTKDLMAMWRQSGGASVREERPVREASDEGLASVTITHSLRCTWIGDEDLTALAVTMPPMCHLGPADEALSALNVTMPPMCRFGPADEALTALPSTVRFPCYGPADESLRAGVLSGLQCLLRSPDECVASGGGSNFIFCLPSPTDESLTATSITYPFNNCISDAADEALRAYRPTISGCYGTPV